MKVGWIGNALFQASGYGRVAHYVLPYLKKYSRHDIIQFANTGLTFNRPFEVEGVQLYGQSGKGGKFGVHDIPHVDRKENIDIWIVNFDLWTVHKAWDQIDIDYVLYPPVDHTPLPYSWAKSMEEAREIVPYCNWGKKVIENGIDETFRDNVKEPIYHGVDPETYHPIDISKSQAFGIDISEDTFVAGIYKNNQGLRPRFGQQLKGFKEFYERVDGNAKLYLHTNEQGNNGFDLRKLIQQLRLGDGVILVNQSDYKYALPEATLNQRYNACDVGLNVTASEGFGLTIIEAFATETPVIAGGFSAMPEVLSGETDEVWGEIKETNRGWLVPVHNREITPGKHSERANYSSTDIADALTMAYEKFKTNNLEEKGKNARQWAKRYSWTNINEQWISYLNGLEDRLLSKPEAGEQKEAYIVVGPESTGTRLTTKIMMELGCEGDDGHKQKWDANLPTDEDKIVWRRSVPHDGEWPDLQEMAEKLRGQGYSVTAIVTMRDMKSTYNSQINADYLTISNPRTAFNQVRKAYQHIFSKLGDINYIVSSFDNLITRPDDHIEWLKESLELEGDVDIEVKDANAKYYDGGQNER